MHNPQPNLTPNPSPSVVFGWGGRRSEAAAGGVLPTGTVTFLFTDIQGSTPLWEREPEKMAAALQIHNAALRGVIEANGGAVFKIVGDAFQAAFATAPQALKAAIDGQRALQSAAWNELGELKVRMGLHTGEAELDPGGDEYAVSHTKNRAARIMSAAHGGQILISQESADLVLRQLPEGVTLKDLGEHSLKGMALPEHLYQACASNLPQDFPPLATAISHPNNLPMQMTSFIGREKEIAEIKQLVTDESIHLVTLTGAGGTGKTRLSLQVAAEALENFTDGVFFVPLAPIVDPSLVLSTIAVVMDVRESLGKSLFGSLKDTLSEKQLLLILDNFEQVSAAASWVGDLLSTAPGLKIMVTSREMLHIYGEHDYPVPSLGLPDPHHLPAFERLRGFEALQLFIQRAQAAKPDFAITAGNAPTVAEICCHLDGLPLAIELAAARVRLLPPETLLSRLKNRLLLLTGGSRNLPTRQQTLRNTIAWSYNLLNIVEQQLFAHLSVFIGGCTLEAAEEVCQADHDEKGSVLDGLEALVDKSLLKQEEVDRGPRFIVLETIHEYASEKLLESGDAEQIRRRHAHFFLKLAQAARPFLEQADQAIWLERLEREHANLRAALDWAKEDDQIMLEVPLVEALCIFWFMRGHLVEGRARLIDLLSLPKIQGDTPVRASLLNQAGFLARYQGDYEGAYTLISESLAICREQGNRLVTADVMANLGYVVLHQANYEQARTLYTETLAIYRELDNGQGMADSLSHLALIAFYEGDYETARHYDEESLKIWRSLEDKQGVAWALYRLGNVLFHQGDHRTAANLYRESLSTANELGFKWGIACALEGFASIASAQGLAERALCLAGAATALRQEISVPLPPAGISILENALASAWQALSKESASAAWAKGQTMALAESVSYALEEMGEISPSIFSNSHTKGE